MNTLYSTKVTAVGGRHGHVKSADGLLDLDLALPRELGGAGRATNPETLFAAGYSACFENAIFHVARSGQLHLADEDVTVIAEIGLSRKESGGFVLQAALNVTIAGVTQDKAEALAAAAHQICPYSNAVRGNIDVPITVQTDRPSE
jgi:osmotically inducible protein OsmC